MNDHDPTSSVPDPPDDEMPLSDGERRRLGHLLRDSNAASAADRTDRRAHHIAAAMSVFDELGDESGVVRSLDGARPTQVEVSGAGSRRSKALPRTLAAAAAVAVLGAGSWALVSTRSNDDSAIAAGAKVTSTTGARGDSAEYGASAGPAAADKQAAASAPGMNAVPERSDGAPTTAASASSGATAAIPDLGAFEDDATLAQAWAAADAAATMSTAMPAPGSVSGVSPLGADAPAAQPSCPIDSSTQVRATASVAGHRVWIVVSGAGGSDVIDLTTCERRPL